MENEVIELEKKRYGITEVTSHKCGYCNKLFKYGEDAYRCLLKHITANYRGVMWDEGRTLAAICSLTNYKLISDEYKIASKIHKGILINIKPPAEPSKWDVKYSPYKNRFNYGYHCDLSIETVIECIIEQKVELKEQK